MMKSTFKLSRISKETSGLLAIEVGIWQHDNSATAPAKSDKVKRSMSDNQGCKQINSLAGSSNHIHEMSMIKLLSGNDTRMPNGKNYSYSIPIKKH